VPAPLPPAVVPPPVPRLVPAAPARSPVLPPPVVSRPVDPPPEPPVPPPPPGPPTRRASATWALFAREPHPAARSASRVRMTTVAAHRRRLRPALPANVIGVLTVPPSTRPSRAECRPCSDGLSGR